MVIFVVRRNGTKIGKAIVALSTVPRKLRGSAVKVQL
jgi:hypothetical protein